MRGIISTFTFDCIIFEILLHLIYRTPTSLTNAVQQLGLDSSGPEWNARGSTELLSFGEVKLAAMVGVLTGHYTIGSHAVRLYILSDTNCQSCIEEGKAESYGHFLFNGTAFAGLRLKHFGMQHLRRTR